MGESLNKIVRAIRGRQYIFKVHIWENLVKDMTRPLPTAIIASIGDNDPEIIEHYVDDPRGSSCLILGVNGQGNQIHTVVSYKHTPMKIITAYHPSDDLWIDGRIRK